MDRLNTWLTHKGLDSDVKEELEFSKKAIERMLGEFKDRLSHLKKSKKATMFMIDNIEKELRD